MIENSFERHRRRVTGGIGEPSFHNEQGLHPAQSLATRKLASVTPEKSYLQLNAGVTIVAFTGKNSNGFPLWQRRNALWVRSVVYRQLLAHLR
ncbi:hypothetical protein CQ052_18535 [Ochrobactrum sp. MYb15]|nr:hypothetical protein CWE02_07790 [Brucella pituitosa]PQZ48407.1 hypothetical protein CQZ90_16095 [Ochrobactrum sp. MYb19]PRA51646.1 hypothetical protein CQ062_20635 [Ochrobactrum sp. MYb68]PRA64590.1 hypothetical protein CQ053_14620 [Ochrobactrum sp. MYb18]PRA74898.1 hypothetical protein CQ049_17065 [Brucella thiophenivorans]PRA83830.1 hypothetical protein CQ054_18075 [Ochrobactrum sp. MYb29]PRA89889.1 hypothetical protein CQ051_16535 [Ochrobactrum sp. MYb14]PRA96922.1 hypothetical protei